MNCEISLTARVLSTDYETGYFPRSTGIRGQFAGGQFAGGQLGWRLIDPAAS